MLLNQFHDVLPGSSIELVYDDAIKMYKDVAMSGSELLAKAQAYLSSHFKFSDVTVSNTTSWKRSEVIEIPAGPASKARQKGANGSDLYYGMKIL